MNRLKSILDLQDLIGSLPAGFFTEEELKEIYRELRTSPFPGLYLGRKISDKLKQYLMVKIKEYEDNIPVVEIGITEGDYYITKGSIHEYIEGKIDDTKVYLTLKGI